MKRLIIPLLLVTSILIFPLTTRADDYPDSMEDVLIHNNDESTHFQQEYMLREHRPFESHSSDRTSSPSGASKSELMQNLEAWKFTWSQAAEHDYIIRCAARLVRIGYSQERARRLLTGFYQSFRASRQLSPYTLTGGAYSLKNAIAYVIESSAFITRNERLPDNLDRTAVAMRLLLDRSESKLLTQSNASKQEAYEAAILVGSVMRMERNAGDRRLGTQILASWGIPSSLLSFAYRCDGITAPMCQQHRTSLRRVLAAGGE
jgi:hypothetical protein